MYKKVHTTYMTTELVTEDLSGGSYLMHTISPRQGDLFAPQYDPSPEKLTRDATAEQARRQRIEKAMIDNARRAKRHRRTSGPRT